MPYISSERVAEIRKEIKKQFPDYKFSITKEHHSSVNVAVLSGPMELIVKRYRYEDDYEARQMEKRHQSVARYAIKESYKDYPEIEKMMSKIYDIMNEGNGVEVEDGDYGTVPHFYVNLSIGQWDKPFQYIPKKSAPVAEVQKVEEVKEVIEVVEGEVNIIDYSEKAIAVIGDTKPIKEKLKELGGRFNFKLSCGPGWIFPKTQLSKIQTALSA